MDDQNTNAPTADDGAAPNHSKRQLWILIVLFFGPLLAAIVLYFGMDYRPPDRTNYGALNEPVLPLPDTLALTDRNGAEIDRGFFEREWIMLQVLPTPCAEACKNELYRTRQIWSVLDRRRTRVRRVAVVDASVFRRLQDQADEADPNLTLLKPSKAKTLAGFLRIDAPNAGDVYLIDPLGNWVMTWPAGYEPSGVKADMKKLLRLSKIG